MDEPNGIAHLAPLLEHKLAFIDTLAQIGMTWWVSSVVFCGSTLAGVWLKHAELVLHPRLFRWIQNALTWFFLSIVLFGIFIMWQAQALKNETRELVQLIKSTQPANAPSYSGALTEFDTVIWGMCLGTTSFVLVLLAWIVLCNWIRSSVKSRRKKQSEPSAA